MRTYNLIGDLMFRRETPAFYVSSWRNKLTHTEIHTKGHAGTSVSKGLCRVLNIPSYFDPEQHPDHRLRCLRLEKNPGYLIDLSHFSDADEYLTKNLSQRNRKNLFSKKKKLEASHEVEYRTVQAGTLDGVDYESLFGDFYDLLKKRFDQKRIYHRDLENWHSLKESTWRLLSENKAWLQVIYINSAPASITLNLILKDHVLSHIQAFDTRYTSYNLPDISMLKQLQWCFENHIVLYDFLIGYTYYKKKWASTRYTLENRIYFSPDPCHRCCAYLILYLYRIKALLKRVLPSGIHIDRILFYVKGGNP
jgi:CelD/BcsL family acetyltransferase involved in cellulose biosynthesis